jgi:hypothetical protein
VLECARRKAKVSLFDRRPWETVRIEVVVPARAGRDDGATDRGTPERGAPRDGK